MFKSKKLFIFILVSFILLSLTVIFILETNKSSFNAPNFAAAKEENTDSKEIPKYTAEIVTSNLSNPWDMVMLPDYSFIFTERNNKIYYFQNNQVFLLHSPADTYVSGEGGMLGLAIDPNYDANKFIYVCFNSNINNLADLRVVRFNVNIESKSLTSRTDIVTGIPSNVSGRHSGCQLEFGPDGYLWIGTGDAANSTNPQDPKSLGGKILRVDKNGNPAENNLGGEFDLRVFSYGHRNVQGIAFFDLEKGFNAVGINIEHGSTEDDEVNPLFKGNFGWDPKPPYNESNVLMTDKLRFPDAVSSLWSSGSTTIATSGGTIIKGSQWGEWDQALAVGIQKEMKILIFEFNKDLSIKRISEILKKEYGRIRTVTQGSDGNLYILTDNGGAQDKIIKLMPR